MKGIAPHNALEAPRLIPAKAPTPLAVMEPAITPVNSPIFLNNGKKNFQLLHIFSHR